MTTTTTAATAADTAGADGADIAASIAAAAAAAAYAYDAAYDAADLLRASILYLCGLLDAQQTAAALVEIARADERQAIPVVVDDDTDPDYFAGGRADAMKALRGRSPVYRRTEYGSREDRSYDRGWNAVIDAWKPSDREDAEASRGDHEREMRREADIGGEG